jgi:hypothetical protein
MRTEKSRLNGPYLFERVLARRGIFVMDKITFEEYDRRTPGGFRKVLTDEMGMTIKDHPNGLAIIRPDVYQAIKRAASTAMVILMLALGGCGKNETQVPCSYWQAQAVYWDIQADSVSMAWGADSARIQAIPTSRNWLTEYRRRAQDAKINLANCK